MVFFVKYIPDLFQDLIQHNYTWKHSLPEISVKNFLQPEYSFFEIVVSKPTASTWALNSFYPFGLFSLLSRL